MKLSTIIFYAFVVVIVTTLPTNAFANTPYHQGFEIDASGWYYSTPGIDRHQSGSGPLALTAPDGSYYAQVNNDDADYSQNNYGGGGASVFGGLSAYPGNDFFQSVDVYLDTSWPAVTSGRMSVDFVASNTTGSNYDWNTESRFGVFAADPSAGFSVRARGAQLVTLTTTGWYTFRVDYFKGSNPTDNSTVLMSVLDDNGTVIASQMFDNCDNPSTCTSNADLGGTGFVNFLAWRLGFANDMMGIDNVRSGFIAGDPLVSLSTASIDFGDIEIGTTSSSQNFMIENTGGTDLNLGALALSGANSSDFTVITDGCSNLTLTPTNTCSVDVEVTPSILGPLTAQIDIPSNALTSPDSVDLITTGVQADISLSPNTLDFGFVAVGNSLNLPVNVTNSGSGNLIISTISSPNSPFSLVGGTCLAFPVTLMPNQSCDLIIEFAPQTFVGVFNTSIDIVSNAPSSPTNLTIRGNSNLEAIQVPTLNNLSMGLLILFLGLLPFLIRTHKIKP